MSTSDPPIRLSLCKLEMFSNELRDLIGEVSDSNIYIMNLIKSLLMQII